MALQRLSKTNGKWQTLLEQWEQTCELFEEDFRDYAPASMAVLRPLAEAAQEKNVGVYAVEDAGQFTAIAHLNVARLPNYDGRVLRVRHITTEPGVEFDGGRDIEDYVHLLVTIFMGVLKVSSGEMLAPHVKFHFRSPAERQYFAAFQGALKDAELFDSIEMRGSWLYIKKLDAI